MQALCVRPALQAKWESDTRASIFRRGHEPPAGFEKLEQPVSGARHQGLILQHSAQLGRGRGAPAHKVLEFRARRVWSKEVGFRSPRVDSREK